MYLNTNEQNGREALESELVRNESEIRRLSAELERLKSEWGADGLDRRLAQNRARIGDFGNARAHLGDINARNVAEMQWRWQGENSEKEKKRLADAEIKKLRSDLFGAQLNLEYSQTQKERELWNQKVQELRAELYERTGKTYLEPSSENATGFDPKTATPEEAELFRSQNTNDKGEWITEDARRIYSQYKAMTAEGNEAHKAAIKNDTISEAEEKRRAAAAAFEQRKRKADEIAAKYSGMSHADFMAFRNRWNNPDDSEIRILKEFYDIGDGYLVRKGGR